MENSNQKPKEKQNKSDKSQEKNSHIEDLNQEENRENEELIKVNNGIEVDEIDRPEEGGQDEKA